MTIKLENKKPPHVEVKLYSLDSPFDLSFKHKQKTYEITFIRQQIGENTDSEREIDLKEYADLSKLRTQEEKRERIQELQQIIEEAKKIIDLMETLDKCPEDLKSASFFTFNFSQKYDRGPHLLEPLTKRLNKKWKWEPQPIVLESITYKEKDVSEDKTFVVKFNDEKKKTTVVQQTHAINLMIRRIFDKKAPNTEAPLIREEPKAPLLNEEPMDPRSSGLE